MNRRFRFYFLFWLFLLVLQANLTTIRSRTIQKKPFFFKMFPTHHTNRSISRSTTIIGIPCGMFLCFVHNKTFGCIIGIDRAARSLRMELCPRPIIDFLTIFPRQLTVVIVVFMCFYVQTDPSFFRFGKDVYRRRFLMVKCVVGTVF